MAFQGKHSSGYRLRTGTGRKQGVSAGQVILIIIMVLLILFILFSAGALVVTHYLNQIGKIEEESIVAPEDAADEVDDPEDVEEPDGPVVDINNVEMSWDEVEALEEDNLINILLVGQDSRTGERERSDCMIVASINPDTGAVSLISFMRDLYVQMPEGYQDNRMNAAYAFGGFSYLYEVLETNFGIHCAGGFEVNFEGFRKVVDTLGGIDVELTSAEANHLKNGLVEGMNHLDGNLALSYARIRKIDNDFNRTRRQRTVLTAMFEKIKGADLTQLLELIQDMLPNMKTDLTNSQIMSLAMKMAPLLSDVTIKSCRIPTDDGYYDATVRGMMVLVPYLDINRRALQEDFLPYSD